METKQKDKCCLRDVVSTEFNLIKTSETIGGALTHLGVLIAKVCCQPHIDCIIASAETELAEEDRIAFENLEKAVAWFHEKIRSLLPHVKWAPDSFAMAGVNALLNFHTLSLSANGYAGSLLFQLKHLYSEVAEEEKHCPLFEGWMRTEKKHGYSVEVFEWPDYVDKSLNSLPPDQQLHQWKEKADTSFPCLLRFLKILSLYPTFTPLILPARPTVDSLPKNLLQLEERQYQATVGYYLSAFRSSDPRKHPLSILELIKLIDRFLYMLEQRLEFDTPNDGKSPIQVNISFSKAELDGVISLIRSIKPRDSLKTLFAAQIVVGYLLGIRKLAENCFEDQKVGLSLLHFSNEAMQMLIKKQTGATQNIVVNYSYNGQGNALMQTVGPNGGRKCQSEE